MLRATASAAVAITAASAPTTKRRQARRSPAHSSLRMRARSELVSPASRASRMVRLRPPQRALAIGLGEAARAQRGAVSAQQRSAAFDVSLGRVGVAPQDRHGLVLRPALRVGQLRRLSGAVFHGFGTHRAASFFATATAHHRTALVIGALNAAQSQGLPLCM